MADFDKFDDPSYSGDVEFEDESPIGQVTGAIGPLKKFLPHIIALIVIVVVAFLAYDFFIGSMLSVTVTIEDTEGKMLNDNSIKTYAEGQDEAIFTDKDSSIYDLQIKPGTYRYIVAADGYDEAKNFFTVNTDDKIPVIKIKKDLDVDIIDFEQNFPKKLYAGSTTNFSIKIKNNDDLPAENVEIVAENDIEGWINASVGTIQPNSTKDVQIEIVVPKNAEISDEEEGEQKTAGIRVKYTTKKADSDFVLYSNPAVNMDLDEVSLGAGAGEKDQDTVGIENDNDFPIENLTLSIEITTATNNSPDEIEQWFQFTEVANQSNPQEIEITRIEAGEDVEKELQVIIPITAQEEEDIKGNIILNAPYLSEPIKRTLTLDVTEGADYGIAISTRSPVDIEWDEIIGGYEEKIIDIEVDNTGNLDLENIVLSISNKVICNNSWLTLIDYQISNLPEGETEKLKARITAPISVRGREESMHCNMHYRYDDPTRPGVYVEKDFTDFIEIVPEPD